VTVDRERARAGAWYEMFPRSAGPDPSRSATFREAAARLPEIAAMGFDVVYLPPIHPIGTTDRKGRGNSLIVQPGDPGSPWAIGAATGGHMAVEPGLGTLDDFCEFRERCERLGMEVALDLAYQCSPDHPYVTSHPGWFRHRPDGTIKFAENPPKKYQDIYPLDFDTDDWRALWLELRDVVLFWVSQGVRIFRVDNPHTKPMAFWEWMIADVQALDPGVIFLSEAFTRPKVMRYLAKVGFTQSYTYFTWRNTKAELEAYLTELTQTEMQEYFRPNFFANTPDILHAFLQEGGPPAFRIRLVLAATLAASYGIYSGFEICENRAVARHGGVPPLGEVPVQAVGLGAPRPHQGSRGARQPDPPRRARAGVQRRAPVPPDHQRRPDRLQQDRARRHAARLHGGEPRSAPAAGRRRLPGPG
jgi:starch synthase (maltosyl-transferring)